MTKPLKVFVPTWISETATCVQHTTQGDAEGAEGAEALAANDLNMGTDMKLEVLYIALECIDAAIADLGEDPANEPLPTLPGFSEDQSKKISSKSDATKKSAPPKAQGSKGGCSIS